MIRLVLIFKQIGHLAYDIDNECVVNRSLPKKQKTVSEIIEYNDTVLRKRYNFAK